VAGAEAAVDLVGDRRAVARDREEVLAGALDALLDRDGDLVRLAVADADLAVLVADDDERREREATAALDDLGDALISTTRSCRSESERCLLAVTVAEA